MNQVKIVKTKNNHRYIVIDSVTGEIIDDAQGYGYQSVKNALKSYRYKTKDSEAKLYEVKACREISNFCMKNPGIINFLKEKELELLKTGKKLNAAQLKRLFQEYGIDFAELSFTTGDFLRYRNKKIKK